MKIEYHKVIDKLKKEIPNFEIDNDYIDLPYIIAGDFSRYLLEAFKDSETIKLKVGFNFIEELHTFGDYKTKELATVGYLEAIQNTWPGKGVDPELIIDYLGPVSKKYWAELNKFWDGEVRYIGESFKSAEKDDT